MKYFYSRYWGIFSTANPETDAVSTGIIGFGYSGHSANLNDIHKANIQGVGPLPAGTYIITEVYDDPKRGRHTCRLKAAIGNKMFGRDGFLIHGDTEAEAHEASDGCIIAPYWVRLTFKAGDEIDVI